MAPCLFRVLWTCVDDLFGSGRDGCDLENDPAFCKLWRPMGVRRSAYDPGMDTRFRGWSGVYNCMFGVRQFHWH